MTDATTFGIWSITNAHAPVSGRLVTGISPGTNTVLYIKDDCHISAPVTVSPAPVAISPATAIICIRSSLFLQTLPSVGRGLSPTNQYLGEPLRFNPRDGHYFLFHWLLYYQSLCNHQWLSGSNFTIQHSTVYSKQGNIY